MYLMMRVDFRKSTNVGFYEQFNVDEYKKNTHGYYKLFIPFVKKYEDRYSENLLTRYSLWEFQLSEHIGSWKASPGICRYQAAHANWNQSNGIDSRSFLDQHSVEISKKIKETFVTNTWPKKCCVINEFQEFMPDRMIAGAKKPVDDRLAFEEWLTTL